MRGCRALLAEDRDGAGNGAVAGQKYGRNESNELNGPLGPEKILHGTSLRSPFFFESVLSVLTMESVHDGWLGGDGEGVLARGGRAHHCKQARAAPLNRWWMRWPITLGGIGYTGGGGMAWWVASGIEPPASATGGTGRARGPGSRWSGAWRQALLGSLSRVPASGQN